MILRREFLLTPVVLLGAQTKLDRSCLSVLTDEVGPDIKSAIAFCKRYKLRWVELRVSTDHNLMYDALSIAQLKEAAKQLSDAGLRISFLNTAMLKYTLPGTVAVKSEDWYENMYKRLGLTPEKMLAERKQSLERALTAAQILGVKQIRSFTFWRVANPASVYPRLKELFQEMEAPAKKAGVRILVENEYSTNVATSDETVAFLKLLPSNQFGLNWDPQNSASAGEAVFPAGYNKLPKARIANVQLKAEGLGLLGTGNPLDCGGIIRALYKDGYKGLIGLETHSEKPPAENVPISHKCIEKLIELVELVNA